MGHGFTIYNLSYFIDEKRETLKYHILCFSKNFIICETSYHLKEFGAVPGTQCPPQIVDKPMLLNLEDAHPRRVPRTPNLMHILGALISLYVK